MKKNLGRRENIIVFFFLQIPHCENWIRFSFYIVFRKCFLKNKSSTKSAGFVCLFFFFFFFFWPVRWWLTSSGWWCDVRPCGLLQDEMVVDGSDWIGSRFKGAQPFWWWNDKISDWVMGPVRAAHVKLVSVQHGNPKLNVWMFECSQA